MYVIHFIDKFTTRLESLFVSYERKYIAIQFLFWYKRIVFNIIGFELNESEICVFLSIDLITINYYQHRFTK